MSPLPPLIRGPTHLVPLWNHFFFYFYLNRKVGEALKLVHRKISEAFLDLLFWSHFKLWTFLVDNLKKQNKIACDFDIPFHAFHFSVEYYKEFCIVVI